MRDLLATSIFPKIAVKLHDVSHTFKTPAKNDKARPNRIEMDTSLLTLSSRALAPQKLYQIKSTTKIKIAQENHM